jgi:hypothetical protein
VKRYLRSPPASTTLVPGQDTALVCLVLYLKAIGKKAKIILPWIGPFPVLEGSEDNNNSKVSFASLMLGFHPSVTSL